MERRGPAAEGGDMMSRQTWIGIAVVLGIVALLTLYGAIRLGKRLFVTRRMLGELGTGGKVAFYGALFYTFFPIDILPDPIYLDDMAVLGGALLYLTKLLRTKRGAAAVARVRSAVSRS
jgi:4-amino-4-deoxy-L-arabinose transferase-like glycosyltransferase